MDALELNPNFLKPGANFNRANADTTEEKRRQIAQDFEATFISQMLKPMFEGLKSDGMFGGGAGEEMWRGFLVEEMGKQTARAGGIGLSNVVMNHMLKAQEAAQ